VNVFKMNVPGYGVRRVYNWLWCTSCVRLAMVYVVCASGYGVHHVLHSSTRRTP